MAWLFLLFALTAVPDPSAPELCAPCDGLDDVGAFRVHVEAGRETLEGHGDRAAVVSVYREDGDRCCLVRTKQGYPGVYLYGLDPSRGRVFLAGHDAQWSALATNGIWSYDAQSGALEPVASHVWRDLRCEARPLRVAAILQRDGKSRADPYGGSFRLVVFDLETSLAPLEVAQHRDLRLFDPLSDDAVFAARFHWSPDCTTLTWAASPKGPARVFHLPATR